MCHHGWASPSHRSSEKGQGRVPPAPKLHSSLLRCVHPRGDAAVAGRRIQPGAGAMQEARGSPELSPQPGPPGHRGLCRHRSQARAVPVGPSPAPSSLRLRGRSHFPLSRVCVGREEGRERGRRAGTPSDLHRGEGDGAWEGEKTHLWEKGSRPGWERDASSSQGWEQQPGMGAATRGGSSYERWEQLRGVGAATRGGSSYEGWEQLRGVGVMPGVGAVPGVGARLRTGSAPGAGGGTQGQGHFLGTGA